jgi:hypothetical protein
VSVYFWDCWDPDKGGCDKRKWIKKYYDKCDRTMKRRSPTREKTELLIGEITEQLSNQYKVLDTNIHHKYSTEMGKLSKEEREDTGICDYLIENIVPKLIFVHGKHAIKHLEGLTSNNEKIPKDRLISIELNGRETYVYAGYHLSRCWSYEAIKNLGQQLRKWCEANL